MTQEEAKKFGLNILHGVLARNEKFDPSYANLVKEAIDALSQPFLPSNLDEAAEKYANRGISSNADPYEETIAYRADKDAFKAEAEWMAGQGIKTTATVGYYNHCGLSILIEPSLEKQGFKKGDKLKVILSKQ